MLKSITLGVALTAALGLSSLSIAAFQTPSEVKLCTNCNAASCSCVVKMCESSGCGCTDSKPAKDTTGSDTSDAE